MRSKLRCKLPLRLLPISRITNRSCTWLRARLNQFVRGEHSCSMCIGMPLQTYYGNPLSCTWSHDGQYIAAGGEDDLVSVFGMEEQRIVAWGEGHGSWVSAVSFDPWCDWSPFCTALSNPSCHHSSLHTQNCLGFRNTHTYTQPLRRVVRQNEGEPAGAPSMSSSADVDMDSASESMMPASISTSYRLGSVGQDCQLCLWDLVVPPQRHRLAQASRCAFTLLCTASSIVLPSQSQCPGCHPLVRAFMPFAA